MLATARDHELRISRFAAGSCTSAFSRAPSLAHDFDTTVLASNPTWHPSCLTRDPSVTDPGQPRMAMRVASGERLALGLRVLPELTAHRMLIIHGFLE